MVSALRNTSGMITALPRLSTTPPSSSVRERVRRAGGSRDGSCRRSPRRSPPGCWWMISAPSAACTGQRNAEAPRRESSSESSGCASAGRASSARPSASPMPRPSLHAGDERLVHLAPGLLGHAEGAVLEPGGDVLGGRAEAGDLVVVDRRRAVHRHVRDDAAPHQLDEHRGEPGLHDVAAEHDDDAALAARGGGDGARPRRGSRAPRGRRAARGGTRAKRAVAARAAARSPRRSPCSAAPRPGWCGRARDRPRRGCRPCEPVPDGASVTAGDGRSAWAGRYDLRYRLREPNERPRLHLQHDAVLVVRKPDLGVAVLGEDARRLDDRLDDDRVELAGGHADALLAQHLDGDRVAVGPEVAVEGVGLPDGERDGADEVQERAVVERVLHARLPVSSPFSWNTRALGKDLEGALHVAAPLVEVLPEAAASCRCSGRSSSRTGRSRDRRRCRRAPGRSVCQVGRPRTSCTPATSMEPVPTCSLPNFTSYSSRSPTPNGTGDRPRRRGPARRRAWRRGGRATPVWRARRRSAAHHARSRPHAAAARGAREAEERSWRRSTAGRASRRARTS